MFAYHNSKLKKNYIATRAWHNQPIISIGPNLDHELLSYQDSVLCFYLKGYLSKHLIKIEFRFVLGIE